MSATMAATMGGNPQPLEAELAKVGGSGSPAAQRFASRNGATVLGGPDTRQPASRMKTLLGA